VVQERGPRIVRRSLRRELRRDRVVVEQVHLAEVGTRQPCLVGQHLGDRDRLFPSCSELRPVLAKRRVQRDHATLHQQQYGSRGQALRAGEDQLDGVLRPGRVRPGQSTPQIDHELPVAVRREAGAAFAPFGEVALERRRDSAEPVSRPS
jgi:hypothetical protein